MKIIYEIILFIYENMVINKVKVCR